METHYLCRQIHHHLLLQDWRDQVGADFIRLILLIFLSIAPSFAEQHKPFLVCAVLFLL